MWVRLGEGLPAEARPLDGHAGFHFIKHAVGICLRNVDRDAHYVVAGESLVEGVTKLRKAILTVGGIPGASNGLFAVPQSNCLSVPHAIRPLRRIPASGRESFPGGALPVLAGRRGASVPSDEQHTAQRMGVRGIHLLRLLPGAY